MKLTVLAILLFVNTAFSILPTKGEKCGQNETYDTCGSSCPETCENRGKAIPCLHKCAAGCACQPGYVRDKSQRCIMPRECPKRKRSLKPVLHLPATGRKN